MSWLIRWWDANFFFAAKRLLFSGVSFLLCWATCYSTLVAAFLCHGGFLTPRLLLHPSLVLSESCSPTLCKWATSRKKHVERWDINSEWMHEGDGWQVFIFPRSSAVWCPSRVTRGTRLCRVAHQLQPRWVAGARATLPWQGREHALSCTRLFSAMFACYFIAWSHLL